MSEAISQNTDLSQDNELVFQNVELVSQNNDI